MGNSHSSTNGRHSSGGQHTQQVPPIPDDAVVDGGRVLPLSHVYASTPQPEDYNRDIIQRLIVERRLAPYFRGLEEHESSWGEPEIDAALRVAESEAANRVARAVNDAREEMKQRAQARTEAAAAAALAMASASGQPGGPSQPLPTAFSMPLDTVPPQGGDGPHVSASSGGPAQQSLPAESVHPAPPIPPNSRPLASRPQTQSMTNDPLPSSAGPDQSGPFPGIPIQRRKEKELPVPVVLSNPPRLFPYSQDEHTQNQEIQLYLGEVAECPICFLVYAPLINRSRCCHQPICTECFVQIKRADPTVTNPTSEPACCPYCAVPDFGVVYERPQQKPEPGPEGSSSVVRNNRKNAAAVSDVVTTDMVHPNWETKLQAVQATIARRANRRIVFRQVGDRLIPVGITSGRPAGSASEASDANTDAGRSRRGGRRNQDQLMMSGNDLEELLVSEAIRLSLLEQEDRERKEQQERARKQPTEQPLSTNGETSGSVAVDSGSASQAAGSSRQRRSSEMTQEDVIEDRPYVPLDDGE